MGDLTGFLRTREAVASAFVPNLIVALFILVVGVVVGWIAARILTAVLTRAGFDRLGARTGLDDDLARVGIAMRPSRLVGRIAYFAIVAAAFVQAINGLELTPISASLGAFLTFLPHVVLAAVIVLAGIIVGDVLGRGTAGAMSRSGVLYHDLVGGVLRTAIVLISILMALEQLTIASAFLFDVLLVALGGCTLGLAIAGGWGARAFAENLIAARYVERHLSVGDYIRIEGQTGFIERFDVMSTILRTDDGRRIIYPNGLLASSVVEAGSGPLPPIAGD
ncbi:MAG: mechanosensitive ion channel [Candidatus Eremiobacteraeota bacterium]|nr:mechanosensitive ion channel [Candidatus Eremiobacteraeota bacterium]